MNRERFLTETEPGEIFGANTGSDSDCFYFETLKNSEADSGKEIQKSDKLRTLKSEPPMNLSFY